MIEKRNPEKKDEDIVAIVKLIADTTKKILCILCYYVD
jgi:hypothetical protein